MITAGTYQKAYLFDTPARRDIVLRTIFDRALHSKVSLQAWAVLANHYHLVASFANLPPDESHRAWIARLHNAIAQQINAEADTPGRRVMYQFWDSPLTFQRSWLARLHYVHFNPVHHGIVPVASAYPWCSARWFESNARPAFVKSVYSFKLDRVQVPDEF